MPATRKHRRRAHTKKHHPKKHATKKRGGVGNAPGFFSNYAFHSAIMNPVQTRTLPNNKERQHQYFQKFIDCLNEGRIKRFFSAGKCWNINGNRYKLTPENRDLLKRIMFREIVLSCKNLKQLESKNDYVHFHPLDLFNILSNLYLIKTTETEQSIVGVNARAHLIIVEIASSSEEEYNTALEEAKKAKQKSPSSAHKEPSKTLESFMAELSNHYRQKKEEIQKEQANFINTDKVKYVPISYYISSKEKLFYQNLMFDVKNFLNKKPIDNDPDPMFYEFINIGNRCKERDEPICYIENLVQVKNLKTPSQIDSTSSTSETPTSDPPSSTSEKSTEVQYPTNETPKH